MLYSLLMHLHILLESLPISSSGHLTLLLIIAERFFGFQYAKISQESISVLHIPTAVILFFFLLYSWWGLLAALPHSFAQLAHLVMCVLIADLITGLCYLAQQWYLLGDLSFFPLPLGFLVTTVLLLSLFFVPTPSQVSITYLHAALLGLMQAVALLPGISRLGATYALACWLGYPPHMAFVFSLTMQFPLVLAAIVQSVYSLSLKTITQEFFLLFDPVVVLFWSVLSLTALVFLSLHTAVIGYFGWYMLLPLILSLFCFS